MANAPEKQQSYYWVGIGASAGGLDAIQQLSQELPSDANMMYIVAQHLSPKHESRLTELVQRNTRLTVKTISDGIEASPNVIYITPPSYDVYVEGNTIRLASADAPALAKPSVNRLFVSLAEEKKEHAIGVILSGTGTDGAHGVKVIRAQGGCTCTQSPDSCEYDGMPNAAIDTECVDFVSSPPDIGKYLSDLSTKLPLELRPKVEAEEVQDKFLELVDLVRKHCGVSFKQYKKATLQRRIERRMLARGVNDLDEYVSLLKSDDEEVQLLYKDILISVTNFFRDPNTFSQLAPVLTQIRDSKSDGEPIRLWVVGCATGEEAYSLAIMLSEALGGIDKLASEDHQIFASDVDMDALTVARKGVYSEASMANVPPQFREKYFRKKDDAFEVIDDLKRIILFSGHNIIDDPPFLRIDLITCRNLLIYFNQELQKKVYRIFHYSLRDRGHLFLGKSESTSQVTDIFRAVAPQDRIFQKRSVSAFNPQRFHLSGKSSISLGKERRNIPESPEPPHLPDTLVEQLGEAGILVNDNLDVEHSYGNTGTYIKFPKGKPSFNLSEIVIELFRHEVRPLVYKAIRTKQKAEGQLRRLTISGEVYYVYMTIFPVQVDEKDEKFLLVCFNRKRKAAEPDSSSDNDYDATRVKELEDELAMAREHIQTVVEELETSNEELQSMNEELQSSNEELQSSNEELETTNEELQSTNEELVTMNDQLNEKTTALELVSNQLVNIKDSLQFPLIYLDRDLHALRANAAAAEFLSLNDELDNVISRLESVFPDISIKEVIAKITVTSRQEIFQTSAKGRHFSLMVTPYFAADRKVDGAILSFIDNTELMDQQQELIEKREQAQQASLAKTEFLANVSHEIRTPLNAIVGVNEVFSMNIATEDNRERLLNILNNATTKLKDLLNDLLDFAKLESGQLTLEYTEFSPQDVIRDLIDLYSVDNVNNSLSISASFDKNLPKQLIGDPLRVQQIITNLLSNAIKFTEQGSINVKAGGRWSDKYFNLVLEVSDTGIGMSKESQAMIFDKFSQADSSISRRFGGSGLGLSITKELVSLMAGRIEVESKEGEGTTFTVALPMQTPKFIKETLPSTRTHVLPLTNIKNQRVLVIEDNEANTVIIESYLKQLGVSYDAKESAKSGLDALNDNEYALILLDLQMDGLDGFEFFRRFRTRQIDGAHINTKVIAVSAHVHDDIIQKCKNLGMNDFLPKPVEIAKLRSMLEKYMDN